jgi:hypothetical protein
MVNSDSNVTNATSFSYKKVECYSDPVLCTNAVCTLKAISRNVKKLTMGCTPVFPLINLQVSIFFQICNKSKVYSGSGSQIHLMQMKKTSANNWMPGLYDVRLDFCEMSMRNSTAYKFMSTLFGKLAPEKLEIFNQFLQPCPYKVSSNDCIVMKLIIEIIGFLQAKWEAISVMNISRQNVMMSSVVSDIFGRSEFKTFARVFDSQNKTVYELILYYS